MSYILDALRKSEQQRQQGIAPTLSSAPLQQPDTVWPEKTKNTAAILIALALLAVGIAIGWLRPWQPQPPATPPVAPAITMPPIAAAPAASPKPLPEIAPPPVSSPPAKPKAQPAVATPAESPTAPPVTPTASALPPPTPAPSSAKNNESPPALQPELPPINITVHAYSTEPNERLAGINGRLLHEGSEISPGLKLERITEEGVILNFKGRRIKRSLR